MEGELPLVDDESGLVLTLQNPRDDVIKGNNFGADIWREQLKRQIGRGHGSRHGDGAARDLLKWDIVRGHDHRPITLADTAAARHQSVLVLDVGISMKRNRGDVVDAVQGFAVQGLDIAKRMGKFHSGHANLVRRHAIKHEGVVGVRTVGDGYLAGVLGGNASHKKISSVETKSRSLDSD